jgi:hypothetical protein
MMNQEIAFDARLVTACTANPTITAIRSARPRILIAYLLQLARVLVPRRAKSSRKPESSPFIPAYALN